MKRVYVNPWRLRGFPLQVYRHFDTRHTWARQSFPYSEGLKGQWWKFLTLLLWCLRVSCRSLARPPLVPSSGEGYFLGHRQWLKDQLPRYISRHHTSLYIHCWYPRRRPILQMSRLKFKVKRGGFSLTTSAWSQGPSPPGLLPELNSFVLGTGVNIPSAPIFPSPSLSAAAIKDLVSDSVSSLAPLSNFWRKNLQDNQDWWQFSGRPRVSVLTLFLLKQTTCSWPRRYSGLHKPHSPSL